MDINDAVGSGDIGSGALNDGSWQAMGFKWVRLIQMGWGK